MPTMMESWNENSYVALDTPSEVKISPDGSRVAYTLTKADLKGDKYETSVIVLGTADNNQQITIENASMVRFSPDGWKIAYRFALPNEEDHSELWIYDLKTSQRKKLIEDGLISEIDWSPDGSKLCVLSGNPKTDPHIYYDNSYPVWFDGRGFLDRESSVVNVYDSNTGSKVEEFEKQVFLMPKSPYLTYFRVALWHNNSSLLLNVFRRESPFEKNDIYLHSSNDERKLFDSTSLHAITSNGNQVVMIGRPEKRRGYMEHNFLYIWNGSSVEPLTPRFIYDDISIPGAEPKLDTTGRLYYLSLRKGRLSLHSLAMGGDERAEVDEDAWVTSFDLSRNGKIALIRESTSEPPEVYILENGNRKKLTSYGETFSRNLSPRPFYKLNYAGVGGLKIDAWYLKPEIKKEAKKAPVVLFIHGGPKGMYGYQFHFLGQYFAAKGYYVLYVNPRGSAGYEEDFSTTIIGKYGEDDFKDIMQGVDELISAERSADSNRLGVSGISGGGFLTNWTITHSKNFKAAISENGICNWFSHYAGSDIGYWFCTELIGKDPIGDDSNYKLYSPIYYSRSVTTPVLFIHSMEDYRCPPDQGIMFHQVLKSMGKESYMAMFKKGVHGHSMHGSPVHRSKRHKLMLDYMDSKLMKNEKEFNPDFAIPLVSS